MIFEGLKNHYEPLPSFFALYGPLLLVALAMGMIAGTVLAMGN